VLNQEIAMIDALARARKVSPVKPITCAAVGLAALFVAGCSTVESRISEHRDLFNSLSPQDQQLVAAGQIRTGMPQSAVWLAWGSADQKSVGQMRGQNTETWIYVHYAPAYGYGGYGYGYPYGPWGPGWWGGGVSVIRTRHHGKSFIFVGDPFFDPFYYSYIPPSIPYPYRTVTFANGRVVSFQTLVGNYY
jgi:hypothetical protein